MRRQPCAEVIAGAGDIPARAIAGVNFGMHGVRLREEDSEQVVYVSREGAEAGFVAHEAMDVDAQELPTTIRMGLMLKVLGIVVVGGREGV
jgi:hypothetical protein